MTHSNPLPGEGLPGHVLSASASAATAPASKGVGGFSQENHMTELTFTAPLPEPLTAAEIADRIPPLPEGWTAQDDLKLVEGLFKLVGLMQIALAIGKPFDEVQDRFVQLRNAAVRKIGPFSLTAQSRLLEVVRGRCE